MPRFEKFTIHVEPLMVNHKEVNCPAKCGTHIHTNFPFESIGTLKELGKSSIIEIVYCGKGEIKKTFGIEDNYEPDGKGFGGG